ncbi:MAG: ABC transporter permease [Actinobacteria bacterium]|nr:ABC transporter permease [Actinomycetota bacterium]
MTPVWYRFRAELRTRWRAWLSLTLLIGVAAGAVIALAAGATRTDSAYTRFLRNQLAYDAAVYLPPEGAAPGLARFEPDAIAALPEVDEAVTGRAFAAGQGVALADGDGLVGTEINRFKILEGRAADQDRVDEVVIGFDFARDHDLDVGDRLRLANPAAATAPDEPDNPVGQAFVDTTRWVLEALPDGHANIVGIEASPGEFPPKLSGEETPNVPAVHLTAAFYRHMEAGPDTSLIDQYVVLVRLEHGSADLEAFRGGIERLSEGSPFQLILQRDQAANVQRSFHLQAVALRLLAALAAIVSALILGQLLVRNAHLEAVELSTLDALGMTHPQRFGLAMLRTGAIAVGAALVAGALAIAVSPLLPRGLARIAEPDPGVAADVGALTVGEGLTVLLAVGLAAWPAWRASRLTVTPARIGLPAARRRPRLASAIAGTGLSPPPTAGIRMALDSGAGRDAVPVRSTVICLTLAALALVAALTFGASLTHLLDSPRLYGVAYDLQFTVFDEEGDFERDTPALLRAEGIEDIGFGYTGLPLGAGRSRFDALALDAISGDIRPPLLEGRQPDASDEIALGTRTMEELGVELGDELEVGSQGGPSVPMGVVGRTVIPPVTDSGRLGEGAVVTVGGAQRLIPELPELDPGSFYVQLPPGVGQDEILAHVADGLGVDPDTVDGSAGSSTPADIVNFGQVESMPLALAAMLGVLGVGTLAHLLATAVRRRRRELALLKTLGFTRGDVRVAVAWQATTVVALALLIGLPLGIAAGRTVWILFADDLGVVPEPWFPVLAVALMVALAVLVANLVAAVPAWVAARTRPATVLRSE